jgi:hypothetical protein
MWNKNSKILETTGNTEQNKNSVLWHEGNSQQYLYEYLIEYLELK